MVVVATVVYAIYAAVVIGAAGGAPLTSVDYVPTMIWAIVASIVASIVLTILWSFFTPRDSGKKDTRDREIGRYGEYAGRWVLITGAVAGLLLAMVRADYFWIANAIYLGFVLSAILASILKIVAYRRGIPTW
jgi:predicted membrane channel-forming protein YqfA (hemolysin III family)